MPERDERQGAGRSLARRIRPRASQSRDIAAAAALFGEECFWRDLVAFTWNIKTLEGAAEISAMLAANLDAVSPSNWRIEGEPAIADGVVEAWLRFETDGRPRARRSCGSRTAGPGRC